MTDVPPPPTESSAITVLDGPALARRLASETAEYLHSQFVAGAPAALVLFVALGVVGRALAESRASLREAKEHLEAAWSEAGGRS
jgi:hypothetical protein